MEYPLKPKLCSHPLALGAFLGFCLLFVGTAMADTAPTPQPVPFAGSVVEVPEASPSVQAPRHHAVVARHGLRPEETAASMEFEVALRMRDFPEFQSRVAAGELIPGDELAAKYLPATGDYQRVADWLKAQGFSITQTDANRLAVFATGSVDAVARAFRVSFARVAVDSEEFTSAVTAPSLPADVAAPVLGIHGLQPHLRLHRLASGRILRAQLAGGGYIPSQILAVYNANLAGITGKGQIIAVVGDAFPVVGDLTTFWSQAGVSQSATNIQQVTVGHGPGSPDTTDQEEIALDTEWSSSIAPGAVVRVYGISDLTGTSFDKAFQKIAADARTYSGLNQFSSSYGAGEEDNTKDYLLTEAQYMANLAAAGVTVFTSSGDSGAFADANSVIQVNYPASDPNVTGVGGTSLTNAGTAPPTESAWSSSGGGQSAFFSRPGWQTGTGVPGGSFRLVPDVSAAADPTYGAYIYFSGNGNGGQTVGGTSWASPTWAGFCALMNQARGATTGLGALNSRLYPLLGTNAFRDITIGGNSIYSAGVGYDMVTGIGVPDITNLVNNLTSGGSAPSIIAQLGNQVIVLGQAAVFSVVADGASPLTYQWQRLPAGATAWLTLSDGGAYSGSATPDLVVSGVTYAMNGDQFQCVVSNSLGTVTSSPADQLQVNPVGVTTLAGLPGDAGYANGTGRAALFNSPGAVRTDLSGNIYVADNVNNAIRMVTPAGVVSTIAGASGTAGSQDGPASTTAEFNDPSGVAIDTLGNIYVADGGNDTVRKISNGNVTTLAGSEGSAGTVDGTGNAARFQQPENIAVDLSGNLYIPDGDGDTIRKISPAGAVTTLAGLAGSTGSADGTGSAARFNSPEGIAVDASGNVYVADSGNNTIRKVTPSGVVTTLAGSPVGASGSKDGVGTAALFNTPTGVAVDSAGNLYVADSGSDTIREVSPGGSVITIAGSAGITGNTDGLCPNARFYTPADVAVDSSGIVYVADNVNNSIRRIVPGNLVAPTIQTQPANQSGPAGQAAAFTVTASGSAQLTYQWQREPSGSSTFSNLSDGGAYSGTATPTLTVSGPTIAMSGDQFQCVVTNNAGSATSTAASLTVAGGTSSDITTQPVSQTINTGGTVVFTVVAKSSQSATTYQWRFNGVNLSDSGSISGATGPQLVIQGSGAAEAGTYDCMVTSGGVSGTTNPATLQVQSTASPGSLSSLSARAFVGTGDDILIGGFYIVGSTSATVLVQALGPAISASPYNVSGTLPDPALSIHQTQNGKDVVLYSNTGWGSSQVLLKAAAAVYALPVLTAGSGDSELLLTLPPGGYTAEVTGAGGDTGVALCGIYQVP
jgi:sugar lactone lactonase YvrE/uncharacterized Zn-binding protein involved in type VI secretion